jgi:hypothetical protein
MKKLIIIAFVSFYLFDGNLIAQTYNTETLQKMYWNYRDR